MGKSTIKWGFHGVKNGDLMGFKRIFYMGFTGMYPLVICCIANWNITMLLMGKSTISMTIFNSYVSLPGRVNFGIRCLDNLAVQRPKPMDGTIPKVSCLVFTGLQ